MSDAGWQPAVDNLQTQINSLNSEVSLLSGQETSQATELSLLATQVASLQTEVSAIQQQVSRGNLLADLSGVSVSNAFDAPVLLSLNGNSVLSMPISPNMDGRPFRITVLGRMSDDNSNNTNFYGTLLLGNSLSSPALVTSSGPGSTGGLFFYELDCFWDSVLQRLFLLQVNEFLQQGNIGGNTTAAISNSVSVPVGAAGSQLGFPVASQSALQFVFSGQWNNTSNPVSLTLSQFKLSLI